MSRNRSFSLWLINFITGISEGLMLPLAAYIIALGCFEGSNGKALLAAVIVSLSGALVFGLARFLGEKEEIHHHHPELAAMEAEREAALMQAIDIDPELSRQVQTQMQQEKERWLKEVRENQLGWDTYDPVRARKSGWQTAAGFGAGGLLISIALFLFLILFRSPLPALGLSLGIFYGFGWYKGKLLGKHALRGAFFQLVTGLVIVLLATAIALIVFISRNGFGLSLMFDPSPAV